MGPSILLSLGLVLIWIGERIVEAPTSRVALTGVGAALVVIAAVARWLRRGDPRTRAAQRPLSLLHLTTVASLGLYAAQSDLFTKAFGASLESSSPKLAGALAVLWPALLAVSLLPTLLVELAFASVRRSPAIEEGRVREALYAGLGLAFTLIFAFSVQYVAGERDAKADFSYFRVTKPGDGTQKLVASLDEPLEVYLFFPPVSDVKELVTQYFEDLQREAPMLKLTTLDQALEPAKSKELGVSANGVVIIKKGGRKETISVGLELEKSKAQLRALDGEVQKKVLQVGKARRTVYFTAGHGERTKDPLGVGDQRQTVRILHQTLQEQNFEVRVLSAAEGLGQEVPKDAAAVFIVGPQRPFAPGEAQTLEAYEKRGGRLFIALDPEPREPFTELLEPLGLSLTTARLAQERGIATVRPPPSKADRVNIATRTFSSHPSATYLNRASATLLLMGAGGLEERSPRPAELSIDFVVKSIAEAWSDVNENFEFDEAAKETRKAWGLLAAVTRKGSSHKAEDELRALVLSDSDGIGDEALPQLIGNQYLVLDGLKWLLGDEQLTGVTNTELDVPLAHNRQQDTAWFYGTTFLAPLAVVGLGALARRRSKRAAPAQRSSEVKP